MPKEQAKSLAEVAPLAHEFFTKWMELPKLALEGFQASGADEERILIVSTQTRILAVQHAAVAEDLTAAFMTASRRAVEESERVLKLGGGINILDGIIDLIKDGINSIIKALSIRDLIDFVKKLLRKIGGFLGKAIQAILEVIDQLWDAVFGGEDARVLHMFAQRHIDTMEQLTALARLERASGEFFNEDDPE